MAVSVLTFVNWRSTLLSTQTALAGTLPSAQSAEGYALYSTLLTAGATYDAVGDDSPRNVSAFSTAPNATGAQSYMIAAVPPFQELDRLCRLVYTTYASTATLAQGQAFGLYAGLTALPPGLTGPTPLTLLWDTALALWTTVFNRYDAALLMAIGGGNASLTSLLANASNVAGSFTTPPVNPSPVAAAASHSATVAVNTAVAGCQTWISSLSFS